ncbi:hypothetical protein RvY_10689 [Ramazzottius varieornatus]|uniref:BED-type domain-containing protein n=1 Tax=Ramazzottius varieornatus TaxID=947166 RepID=A0A1D1VLE4_RAMVA|nr:hypothetical protein RvY_10689 [Ramazzottius varieornatus]
MVDFKALILAMVYRKYSAHSVLSRMKTIEKVFGRRTSLEAELRRHEEEDAERERDRAELYGEEDVQAPSPAASSISTAPNTTSKKRKAAEDIERRAPVFQHWTHDAVRKKSCCKYCKKEYADSNSNTPLSKHKKKAHLNVLEGKSAKERVPDRCRKMDREAGCGVPTISKKAKREKDDKLTRLIVKCSLPFSMVDYKEFVEFVKALNPSYVVPSRNTLKSWLIDDFEKYKEGTFIFPSGAGSVMIVCEKRAT